MRYFLYARKSSEDKNRQVQSIDDQRRVLSEVASCRGMEVVDVIVDEKSAKSPGRSGFVSMLRRIQSGEASGVLCWKLDRLSRNPKDSGDLAWLLQSGLIQEIVTPDKTYGSEDNSILMGVEFGAATQVVRDLSKNVMRGMDSKREKGWMPNKAPIGYKNEVMGIKGAKRILPDERLFPVIQHLWQRILKDRPTLAELYRYMQEQSPIYADGRVMAFSSFDRVFKNPFYCGLFRSKGERHVGKHKAMITLEEFEKAQTILSGKTKLRQNALQFDFKGLFKCGHCDAVITAEQHEKLVKKTQERKKFKYYRCAHRKVKTDCREKPVSEKAVEEYVMHQIDQLNLPPEILEFGLGQIQLEAARDESVETVRQKQLKAEIQAVTKRIQAMRSNMAEESDASIRVDIKREMTECEVKRHGLEQDLKKELDSLKNPYEEITNMLQLMLVLKDRFINGTSDDRKEVVRGLGSNWKIEGQKLHYLPHFVPLAIRKVKNLHSSDLRPFEPTNSLTDERKTVPLAMMSTVWSG